MTTATAAFITPQNVAPQESGIVITMHQPVQDSEQARVTREQKFDELKRTDEARYWGHPQIRSSTLEEIYKIPNKIRMDYAAKFVNGEIENPRPWKDDIHTEMAQNAEGVTTRIALTDQRTRETLVLEKDEGCTVEARLLNLTIQ